MMLKSNPNNKQDIIEKQNHTISENGQDQILQQPHTNHSALQNHQDLTAKNGPDSGLHSAGKGSATDEALTSAGKDQVQPSSPGKNQDQHPSAGKDSITGEPLHSAGKDNEHFSSANNDKRFSSSGSGHVRHKPAKLASFYVLTFIWGFFAGAAVWGVLRVMDIGIDFLWKDLPSIIGQEHSLVYHLACCLAGGLLIGVFQKKNGLLPDNMEEVMGRVKKTGRYPYDRLHIIAIAALLPLIFGGALGPEAGLTGLVAGICTFIGDKLKYKGDQVAAFAEAGFAATIGTIFGAPFFGIVHNLEPDDSSEHYREKLVSKRTRISIYCFGVLGSMIAFYLLGSITGISAGLPRFGFQHAIGISQWKWYLPLIVLGIVSALYYIAAAVLMRKLASVLVRHCIISCLIAGACVAVIGWLFPFSMFSGEHQLGELIDGWSDLAPLLLLLSAAAKLLLVNICICFGWKGGSIFPIIFSGAMLGYAFALFTGMDGAFAAAIVIASMYAYIMRKPVAVIAVLLLCFPVTYIVPIGVSAFISSRIPSPVAHRSNRNGKNQSTD